MIDKLCIYLLHKAHVVQQADVEVALLTHSLKFLHSSNEGRKFYTVRNPLP